MIEETSVKGWLEGLAARGITTQLVNGRVRHYPAKAYGLLTDDELIFLRHHREDIKRALRAGFSVQVETQPTSASVEPTSIPAPPPVPCKWCRCSPCIGPQHEHFFALHPDEERIHMAELVTREMFAALGRRS